jgi:lysophospholipase L1-like esterase
MYRRQIVNLSFMLTMLVISSLFGLALLRAAATWIGANEAPDYLADPKPRAWQEDPVVGYVNKPNLRLEGFGNIVAQTNSAGFRRNEDLSSHRKDGVRRIICIGDSVIWGMRSNLEDSIPGALEFLSRHTGVEVVNAGLIGFSTLQEQLFLESRVLQYDPDMVLVNFNLNDWYPTDDSFGTVSGVYRVYLENLASEGKEPLDGAAQNVLAQLALVELGWDVVVSLLAHPESGRGLMRLFLEIPMARMARLAREHDVRLIYLLIPNANAKQYTPLERQIQRHLEGLGVEVLGFIDALKEEEIGESTPPDFEDTVIFRLLKASRVSEVLGLVSLEVLDPIPVFRRISRLKSFRAAQTGRNYIDGGHPSPKGNMIIAREIRDYLDEHPLPPGSRRRIHGHGRRQ